MTAATRLVFAAALLLLLSSVTLAMHEDEQGKRDWLRKGIGAVHTAVFHPKSKTLKQLYVASDEGVLAALSTLNDGTIRWRHVTSVANKFVCVVPSDTVVKAVTAQGHVYAIAASSGEVFSVRNLELAPGAAAVACNSAFAVAVSHASVSWFPLNGNGESTALAAVGSATLNSAVTGAKIGKDFIWVERNASGIDTIALADGAVVEAGAAGSIRAVSGADDALVAVTQGDENSFAIASDAKLLSGAKPTTCKGCKAGLVLSAETGALRGLVTASRSDKSIKLQLEGHTAALEVQWAVRGTPSILACRTSPQKTELVLLSSSAHLLYVAVSSSNEVSNEVSARWELLEGLSLPALIAVLPQPRLDAVTDPFGFNQLAIVLSTRGTLYAVPLSAQADAHVVADVMGAILATAGEVCWCGTTFKALTADAAGNVLTIVAERGGVTYLVRVELATRAILSTAVAASRVLVTPSALIQGRTLAAPAAERQFLFTIDEATGELSGFAVASGATAVEPTWTVRLQRPIVATASGQQDPLLLKTVESIHIFPNPTTKLNEVRRKYPTANVVVTAHYVPVEDELTSLVVTAVDIITGSVLASTRHPNVEGPVRLLLVENVVVYHFLDAEAVQFRVGVLELFEQEDGAVLADTTPPSIPQIVGSLLFPPRRTFSSFAARPPFVVSSVLKLQHDVAVMGVTTSYGGIARKLVLFATPSGRLHAVDLRSFRVGGNAHPQFPQSTFAYIVTPSSNIASHQHQLAAPQLIATNPTELESSAHVVVAGIDLFYVRLSAGKAFDLLNDDFNHDMLLLVCGIMVGLCIVARYVAKPRMLYQLWA